MSRRRDCHGGSEDVSGTLSVRSSPSVPSAMILTWLFVTELQESYALYIAALKYSSTFAPAFTSLGLYYLQSANPPDTARASKCFQKAFELDAREASAARYLAEGFADEQEWDLVEIVARRTIEGESGQAADPVTAQTQKYLPINAWAWKALGIVELVRRMSPWYRSPC